MNKFNPFKSRNAGTSGTSSTSTAVPSPTGSMHLPGAPTEAVTGDINRNVNYPEKGHGASRNKIPHVTIRTIVMAILVAMGGFIFGYDTGQISGFLEMRVFLERFGEQTQVSDTHPFGYYFTNVRSGLIVGLVCFFGTPFL